LAITLEPSDIQLSESEIETIKEAIEQAWQDGWNARSK
jgi:hypothetical protein